MMLSPGQLQALRVEFLNRQERAIGELCQAHRDGTASEGFMRSRVAVIAELRWLLADLTKKAEPARVMPAVASPEGL